MQKIRCKKGPCPLRRRLGCKVGTYRKDNRFAGQGGNRAHRAWRRKAKSEGHSRLRGHRALQKAGYRLYPRSRRRLGRRQLKGYRFGRLLRRRFLGLVLRQGADTKGSACRRSADDSCCGKRRLKLVGDNQGGGQAKKRHPLRPYQTQVLDTRPAADLHAPRLSDSLRCDRHYGSCF